LKTIGNNVDYQLAIVVSPTFTVHTQIMYQLTRKPKESNQSLGPDPGLWPFGNKTFLLKNLGQYERRVIRGHSHGSE
jgi:hypothetical protein